MKTLKSLAFAGTSLMLAAPVLAQSPQVGDMKSKEVCRQLLQEMRREVRQLDLGQQLNPRVEDIFRNARQASSDEQCVRTLRQANDLISRETGDPPLRDERFRQAALRLAARTCAEEVII
jgi:hypothetical protein